jgi:hypothetical protein
LTLPLLSYLPLLLNLQRPPGFSFSAGVFEVAFEFAVELILVAAGSASSNRAAVAVGLPWTLPLLS